MKIRISILLAMTLVLLNSCKGDRNENENTFYTLQKGVNNDKLSNTVYYDLKILKQIPHNESFYTQGLIFYKGFLYESTGQYGSSALYKIDPNTGNILLSTKIPDDKFAEGIALWKDKIYQLTWMENTCYVYDLNTLKIVRTFQYLGEGWGLACDGKKLFLSDGSFGLKIINPEDFSFIEAKNIYYSNGRPVFNLNELEFDDKGYLYANIWQEDKIVQIDTAQSRVVGIIDLTPLREIVAQDGSPEVSNGIAFLPDKRTFILTGKYWKYYFEVELVERKD